MARTKATEESAEATVEQVETNGADNGETKTRRMPTYGLVEADDLPEARKRTSARGDQYFNLMSPATEQPGKRFRIAVFPNQTGANIARNAITGFNGRKDKETGERVWNPPTRKIPGEPSQWDFEIRTVTKDEADAYRIVWGTDVPEDTEKASVLYATFKG